MRHPVGSNRNAVAWSRRRALLTVLLAASLWLPFGPGRAQAGAPTATVVLTNPGFETLAVDAHGVAWGHPTTAPTQLWSSQDEGATWTRDTGWDTIGRRVWYVTPLSGGTLLAAYETGMNWTIARSADAGATWQTVLALPCMQPDCLQRWTTLGPRSIAEGDGYVFLGTYNNAAASVNTNYIYRSSDGGATWSVVNTPTTFRHVHGLAFDPIQHRLFVMFGDTEGMAVWQSDDDGLTLKPLCTAYTCTMINAVTDPVAGAYIVGATDNPKTTINHILRIATDGSVTSLLTIPYPSYSVSRDGSTILVGETHEPGTITDPQIHVYGSSDGGATWSTLYAYTIPSTTGSYEMHVNAVYPNGDFVAQVGGQGTVVLRLGGSSGGTVPVDSRLPAVSGAAEQGQTLTADTGTWANDPTSYAYRWRRCDSSGSSCSDIPTASAATYVVQPADVGSTLLARVTASNGAGAGAPADSAPTPVVTAGGSGSGGGGGSGGGSGGGTDGGQGAAPAGGTSSGGSSGSPAVSPAVPLLPDLATTVTTTRKPVPHVGDVLLVVVKVTNRGAGGAAGVHVLVTLPRNSRRHGPAIASQGAGCTGVRVLDCDLGSVGVGSAATVKLRVSAASGARLVVAARAREVGDDARLADNAAALTLKVLPRPRGKTAFTARLKLHG